MYYGEELGMRDMPVSRKYMRDPLGLRYWPFHRGRDGSRRPMKWDGSMFSGFSGTDPWLPCDTSDVASVEMQRKDPLSLLHVYREVIQLRNHDHVLRRGVTKWIDLPGALPVLAYVRDDGSDRRLVLLNFSAREVSFSAFPVQKAMESETLRVLYSTVPGDISVEGAPQRLSLQPSQGMICAGG
jgi:alpha-glucosidase